MQRDVYSVQDELANLAIEMRMVDGFFNATKMCKVVDKQYRDYQKNKRTQVFLEELAKEKGMRVKDFAQVSVGGTHEGTWVHPDVAMDLASWCSPRMQIEVAKLVRKYISGELTTADSVQAKCDIDNQVLLSEYSFAQVVYIAEIAFGDFRGIKIGSSDNLKRRVEEHNATFDSFRLVHVFKTINYRRAERALLDEVKQMGVRCTLEIAGRRHNEMVQLTDAFTLQHLIDLATRVIHATEHPIVEQYRKDYEEKLQQEKLNYERKRELEEIEAKFTAEHQKIKEEAQLQLEEKDAEIKALRQEIIQLQDQLRQASPSTLPVIDPVKEFDDYLGKYCTLARDTTADRNRIVFQEFYDHYKQKVEHPLPLEGFQQCIRERFGDQIEIKVATWFHAAYTTIFHLKVKDYCFGKAQNIQKLVRDFIDEKCILDPESYEDTNVFYLTFEEYGKDKGFETMKQNGFSRQNFRTVLLAEHPSLQYKQWLVQGKRHGYAGVRLKNSPIPLPEAIRQFVEQECIKAPGYRTKSMTLWEAFDAFSKVIMRDVKIPSDYTKIKFYRAFEIQNPDLTKKHVTQCDMGFVGIGLRRDILVPTEASNEA